MIIQPVSKNQIFKRLRQIIFTILLFLSHCTRQPTSPIIPEEKKDYSTAFHTVWNDFDQHYSYFVYKNINWHAIKDNFEPLVNEKMTYSFFIRNVLFKMLATLRDNHVTIVTRYGDEIYPFQKEFSKNYKYDQSFERYFSEKFKFSKPAQIIAYASVNEQIGYIRVLSWLKKHGNEIMLFHSILDQYINHQALIIDVRPNQGGLEEIARQIAGRFTTQEKIYAYHQYRNGPNHNDFTEISSRSFGPTGNWQFTKPVMLLIGQECASANEHFITMLSTLAHVTTIGDTTLGSTGRPNEFMLEDSTRYLIPGWISYKSDMTVLEDTGIFPDIAILSKISIIGDRDHVLERAIEEISKKSLLAQPNLDKPEP